MLFFERGALQFLPDKPMALALALACREPAQRPIPFASEA